LRILFVTPFVPDPGGSHGGAVYLGTYLQELAHHAEVALVSLVSAGDRAALSSLPAGLASVDAVPHTPLRDLGSLKRCLHKLSMARAWGAGGLPLLAAKHRSAALASRLQETVRQFSPDVALVEMAVMAQYLRLLDGIPTVLTDHEHGAALPAAIGPRGLGQTRDRRLWMRYVLQNYVRASLVQALNTDDAERLSSLLERPVEIRPPIVPVPADAAAPAEAPERVLFLGNYLHAPNIEAAIKLVEEVWPRVRERRPDAEFWLAGGHAPAAVRKLADRPGVRVIGEIEDLDGLLGTVRLLLAPLYSGGGTRMKVLTSLAHGLPVVSNRLGLRGVDAPPIAARLGESPGELADAVVGLLNDSAAAAEAGAAGRSWAKEQLSPQRLVTAQLERFAALTATG